MSSLTQLIPETILSPGFHPIAEVDFRVPHGIVKNRLGKFPTAGNPPTELSAAAIPKPKHPYC